VGHVGHVGKKIKKVWGKKIDMRKEKGKEPKSKYGFPLFGSLGVFRGWIALLFIEA
jgi:hypothetical protein